VIVGKIYFLLVRIKIKHMEIAIIKRESTGSGQNTFNENETIAKYEIMDGAPVRGESIPIRLFLAGYDLTPTMKDINKKFSVRYYLNLVLVDEEERRYFKQQEIILWRKGEKIRRIPIQQQLQIQQQRQLLQQAQMQTQIVGQGQIYPQPTPYNANIPQSAQTVPPVQPPLPVSAPVGAVPVNFGVPQEPPLSTPPTAQASPQTQAVQSHTEEDPSRTPLSNSGPNTIDSLNENVANVSLTDGANSPSPSDQKSNYSKFEREPSLSNENNSADEDHDKLKGSGPDEQPTAIES